MTFYDEFLVQYPVLRLVETTYYISTQLCITLKFQTNLGFLFYSCFILICKDYVEEPTIKMCPEKIRVGKIRIAHKYYFDN